MPMIGARFYTQLDAAQLKSDILENELAKELENGRLFKLLVKLSTINERPDLNMEPTWAETGDRYMLKLFRDYVFHQVAADGRPWLDMAHVISCLNKLDSGSQDKVYFFFPKSYFSFGFVFKRNFNFFSNIQNIQIIKNRSICTLKCIFLIL